MHTVDDARAIAVGLAPAVRAETVGLHDAVGRVLAADVVADHAVPPWDGSAMDGYAVRAADLGTEGGTLELLEAVHAGEAPTRTVTPGTAVAVATGAPIPDGADAVIAVEDTDGARTGTLTVRTGTTPGRYVRRAGKDVAAGATVLTAGTVLAPFHVGLAASVGRSRLHVARRPVVALVPTGDEVVPPGQPLGPGQIHGSNDVVLAGLGRQAGAEVAVHTVAADTVDALVAALRPALGADALVTTGGVSVGPRDLIPDALAAMGGTVRVHGVYVKPGKPVLIGTVPHDGRDVPVFGLPGNPVSSAVGFLQYVRPWIRAALGDPTPHLPIVEVTCADDLRAKAGRARLERVVLAVEDGRWVCRSTGSQSSGILSSLALGHGLVLIGVDEPGPQPGDRVRVQLLDTRFLHTADVAFGF